MTIATLTGHEVLTYGLIPAVMDNGPASATGHAKRLQSTGDLVGQPVEISRLHNEVRFTINTTAVNVGSLRDHVWGDLIENT